MPDSSIPTRRTRLTGIATALMCALAGGALWALLSMSTRGALAAFSFVIAVACAWALRAYGHAGRPLAALLAGGCVLLAAIYAFALQAAAHVGGMLGIPMREALVKMGPTMTLDLARLLLERRDALVVTVAAVVALVLVALPARRGAGARVAANA